ncbi:MAG: flagellar assembly protein FliH [Thiobacillus sp.]|uniref:flagellar assembly protein FliH n=1 Tax=unclassified Thiobacillus TaxID=2646513 RepID=UPI00086CAD6A|nr:MULTISPECIES: flagellar assembly protein FliH [unclassified Thiobacillus]MBN8772566.1 flagellar assembly protein FliH [Thiobacillus sp.]MBN8779811.1 flagellar assembly protein FliH [Thiobacillus sp.]ODV03198.1 MAG: flagellar assembly protein FliH [Thiobacillus sp. SCN 63-57]QLQ01843.1 MAG: flagellar assembly protein FliH [Thiobacillus sp.]
MSTDDTTPNTPTAFEQWEVVELAASAGQAAPAEADPQAELAALREAARAEGYAEGLAAGRVEGEQACGRMKQLAESFSSTLDNLDFRLADMVLELALDVARQVVAGELAARPERILDVVNMALKQMAETSREARLLLNPDDAALVRPHLDQVLDKNRLRIVEDVRIVRGGCLIETSQGDLDATLPARWRQVVQVLGSNQNWIE